MTQPSNSMRTPLAKARGLGSAKSGVHHWWYQRLTAIAMVPLVLSAIYLIFRIGFWHCMLGIQVVIEDYVGAEWGRISSIFVVKAILILLATLSALSLLKIVSI